MKKQYIGKITGLLAALAIGIGASTSAFAALTFVTLEHDGLGHINSSDGGALIPNPSLAGWATILNTSIGYFNAGTLSGPVSGEKTGGGGTVSGTFTQYDNIAPPTPILPGATSVVNPLAGFTPSTVGESALNPLVIDLGANTYKYLIVRWDGANGADAIYYIGGLTGQISLYDQPGSINEDGNGHNASDYWLSDPTAVPEPSTMIAGALLLLPFGASVVRIVRKNRAA